MSKKNKGRLIEHWFEWKEGRLLHSRKDHGHDWKSCGEDYIVDGGRHVYGNMHGSIEFPRYVVSGPGFTRKDARNWLSAVISLQTEVMQRVAKDYRRMRMDVYKLDLKHEPKETQSTAGDNGYDLGG